MESGQMGEVSLLVNIEYINMTSLLTNVIKIAKKAGQEVLKKYHQDYQIFTKYDQSPVTEADYFSEKIIIDGLKKYGWPILSEESKYNSGCLRAESTWVIDPLDGTMDFIQKTGEFSIMIGLAASGQPVLGVVYLPVQDTVYFAEKGKGAGKQRAGNAPEKLLVSAKNAIKDASLVVSRNHLSPATECAAQKLNIRSLHLCGSNGIKMCLVAEGKADLFFNPTRKLGQWDCCAPQVIAEEAGGKVTGIKGEKLKYNAKNPRNPYGIAVSNGRLHNLLINAF